MNFSQGYRVLNSWCKCHVSKCGLWYAHRASVSVRSARASMLDDEGNVLRTPSLASVSMQSVRSMCSATNSRRFSSDSRDSTVEDEKLKLKNDPEIKAWMNQIAQDFETAPFQALVDEPLEDSLPTFDKSPNESVEAVQTSSDTDIEVEEFGYIEDDEDFVDPAPERNVPVALERGQHGVFDVEEIVAVLEDENGVDIQVIDIPPEARFVDHMVIVSGKSLRHMRAMAESIGWLYKKKKKKSDKYFKLEGRDCNDWFAMDLGNIAVHIFMPDARQHYDIETLWTLGPEHDDERHYVHDDSLNLSAADLFWLESGSNDQTSSPQKNDEIEMTSNSRVKDQSKKAHFDDVDNDHFIDSVKHRGTEMFHKSD